MKLEEKKISSEEIYRGKIINLFKDEVRLAVRESNPQALRR